ncbi:unnamed protein product, partial [Mesorhabditis belari]|uniref:DNA polymerase V n=1 Tax=Mesorhabditis belari TaxID=2138241 RepID=A0AAF3FD85_9BILA
MVGQIPKEVLSIFDDLASLNGECRLKACASLVGEKLDDGVQDYVLNRLITGLSSTRAAARVGFSCALVHCLQKYPKRWKCDDLWKLCEDKLPLNDKDQAQAHAVGRYLFLDSLFASEVYKNNFKWIAEKQLALAVRFQWLSMGVWQSIITTSLHLSPADFQKDVYPCVEKSIPHSLDNLGPEHLLAILLWSKKFGNILQNVPLLSKKGHLTFHEDAFPKLIAILKKTNSLNVTHLIEVLLSSARETNQFAKVYRGVVEAWVLGGAEKTHALDQLFDIIQRIIKNGSTKDLLGIFSPSLLNKLRFITQGKATPEKNATILKVRNFCQSILGFMQREADSVSKEELSHIAAILLKEIDLTSTFDKTIGIRFAETLMAKLQGEDLDVFLQTHTSSGGSSVRRLASIYPQWDLESRKKALHLLASTNNMFKSEDRFLTIANCIDTMFKVKVRAGEKAEILIDDESVELIDSTAKILLKKEDFEQGKKRLTGTGLDFAKQLLTFWQCLRIWAATTPDSDEEKAYLENAQELVGLAAKFKEDEDSFKVLLDLFVALLSQLHRFHRAPVQYLFLSTLPHLKTVHVMHIIEAIALSDEELVGTAENEEADEEDDEEMMEIENAKVNGVNGEKEQNGKNEESDVELSDESESDPEGEVDPMLLSRLKQALGKAAVDETKSGESDLSDGPDDDEMFRLDDGLAAAFKSIGGKNSKKKVQADASRIANPLRIKLLELLLVFISNESTPGKVKLSIAIPLLSLVKTLLRRAKDDTVTKKALELLNVLVHMKKLEVPRKRLTAVLDELAKEAEGAINPVIKKAIGDFSAWLFTLGTEKGQSDPKHVAAFVGLMDKFMTSDEANFDSEVVVGAYTRYPASFCTELPKLIAYGFNEKIRPFRRTEAFLCAAALLRKDVVKVSPLEKGLTLTTSGADIKPRIVAALLKVLIQFVSVCSDDEKLMSLAGKTLNETLDTLIGDEDLWKAGGSLKKLNASCQQINAKTPLPMLKSIRKAVEN